MSNQEHTSTSLVALEDLQLLLAGLDIPPESSASKTTIAPKSSTDTGPMCQSSETSESLTAQDGGGGGLLTGGFPCQPFSQAGEQRGEEDDRALWPEMFRVIKEARPDFVLAENVAGLINMALDDVLSDLEGEGYSTGAVVLPACSLNAPHRRDRVWIMAHSDSAGLEERKTPGNFGSKWPWRNEQSERCCDSSGHTWATEPNVGRVAHGIPSRTHRLKSLGNAIVPQVAYEILKHL
jgi:DNA (cytosine-5)-methyltransferase 1